MPAPCCLASSVSSFPAAVHHWKFMKQNLQEANYNTPVFINDDTKILCVKVSFNGHYLTGIKTFLGSMISALPITYW
jgi:hypothetical protein